MESDDYAIALALQKHFDDELPTLSNNNGKVLKASSGMPSSSSTSFISKKSLIDPEWELIDPNPDIYTLFEQFNKTFFWNTLSMVEVKWSPRMTLCAGLCCYEGHGRLCSVRLSQPLLKLRPRKDLIETLLHEMIHAYLFVTANNKDRDGHGPEFCKHMNRINASAGTNITIYHTFHDEVNEMRKHWWRCAGACRNRPPYFGYVKRAMNRQPSKNDYWWNDHERSCGGTYVKIKEPENYGKKSSKAGKTKSKGETSAKLDPTQRTLNIVSDSKKEKGHVLGGAIQRNTSNSRGIPLNSRLLKKVNQKNTNRRNSLPISHKKSTGKKQSTNLIKVCQDLRRTGSRSVNENAPAYSVFKVKTKFLSTKETKGSVVFNSDDELGSDDDVISSQTRRKKGILTPKNNFKDRLKPSSQSQKDIKAFLSSQSSIKDKSPGLPTHLKKIPSSHVTSEDDFRDGVKRKLEPAADIFTPSSLRSPVKKKSTTSCATNQQSERKTDVFETSSSSKKKIDSETNSDSSLETDAFPIFSTSGKSDQTSNSPFRINDTCQTSSNSSNMQIDEITTDSPLPSTVSCPVCSMLVPLDDINTHIDICLSLKAIEESSF